MTPLLAADGREIPIFLEPGYFFFLSSQDLQKGARAERLHVKKTAKNRAYALSASVAV